MVTERKATSPERYFTCSPFSIVTFVLVLWPFLTKETLLYFVPLLLAGTISQSVVYGEIRLATASLWPAWLMHTIGNAFGKPLLLSGFIQLNLGQELWFSPGAEGIISIILMFAIGFWLHRRGANSSTTD